MIAETRIDLKVPFIEKDQAKQLGAKWDGRTWYVPPGLSLEPFARWLPDSLADNVAPYGKSQGEALALSRFLLFVSQAVQLDVPRGQWVIAEVSEIRQRSGHVYLTLAEHDSAGNLTARCRANIWRSQAKSLLAAFEAATGGPLAADMKVMLKVSAEFHVQHGFALIVDDIDPSYTLGDLAAKLKAIREALIKQKLYDRNKKLPEPPDFFRVAVIAPQQAAGLGDFRREADVLAKYSLCEFDYHWATFQGPSAAAEITAAIKAVEEKHRLHHYDVLVIIRGGGAVTDLAWLNDEQLAAAVCRCTLPVYSGIGHERDNTIVDEVACRRFDTPSKVVNHIFYTIKDNALAAQQNKETIQWLVQQVYQRYHQQCRQLFRQLEAKAFQQIEIAGKSIAHSGRFIAGDARFTMLHMQRQLARHHQTLTEHSRRLVTQVHGQTSQYWRQLQQHGRHQVILMNRNLAEFDRARRQSAQWAVTIQNQATKSNVRAIQLQIRQLVTGRQTQLTRHHGAIHDAVQGQLQRGRRDMVALYKQVIGMGPGQTLKRGFAIVRDEGNQTLTRALQVKPDQSIHIQFHDGHVHAKTEK